MCLFLRLTRLSPSCCIHLNAAGIFFFFFLALLLSSFFWHVDIWFGVLTGITAGKALQSVDVPSISCRFCRISPKKIIIIKKRSTG